MKAISELAKDALELPPVQRLTLARILLDLSEDDGDFSPEAEAAWEEEIQSRIRAVEDGSAKGIPYEQVMREAQDRVAG
jgi:putative addiction module component (TIGR02574 family)